MGSYANDLKRLAKRYGFSVDITDGGHYVLTHPNVDRKLFASQTPRSAWRALRNIEADVRRLIKQRMKDTP